MNFLQNNFIFIFGAISLIGIVFAASELAKTSINPLSTSIETENNAPLAATEPSPKPNQASTVVTKTQAHYQITDPNQENNSEKEGLDD